MVAISARNRPPSYPSIPRYLLLTLLLSSCYPCSFGSELRCDSVQGYNERFQMNCPGGQYVAYLDYVGLGDVAGTCDDRFFVDGTCMRTNAVAVIESLCLGKESCSPSVNETLSMIAAHEMSGAMVVPVSAPGCQTSTASISLKMRWGCERNEFTQGLGGCSPPTCTDRCDVNGKGQPLCDSAGNVAVMADGSSKLCFCDKGCVQRSDCCDGATATCSSSWLRPGSCNAHDDCGAEDYCTKPPAAGDDAEAGKCESCAGCFPANAPRNSVTDDCPSKCAALNQPCGNGVLSASIAATDGFEDEAGVFSGAVCCPEGCTVCGGESCDEGRGIEWPRYPNGYRCCVASYFKAGPKPAGEPLAPGELVSGYFTFKHDPSICVDQDATGCKLP